MTITKSTIIDQIEVARDGSVQVRVGLLMIEDGVEISSRWHRTAIIPGGKVDATLAAVNADIASRPGLGYPAIEADKVHLLKKICRAVHTKEIVKAYRERAVAEEKAIEAAGAGR